MEGASFASVSPSSRWFRKSSTSRNQQNGNCIYASAPSACGRRDGFADLSRYLSLSGCGSTLTKENSE